MGNRREDTQGSTYTENAQREANAVGTPTLLQELLRQIRVRMNFPEDRVGFKQSHINEQRIIRPHEQHSERDLWTHARRYSKLDRNVKSLSPSERSTRYDIGFDGIFLRGRVNS